MKKYILIIFALTFGISSVFTQTDSLKAKELQNDINKINEQIDGLIQNESQLKENFLKLKNQFNSLMNKNRKLNIELETAHKKIDSLKSQIKVNAQSITKTGEELGLKLETSETKSSAQFSQFEKTLSSKTLYGVIGILITLSLTVLLYVLLRKQQNSDKTDVETQIKNTKKSLEEESVKLDSKLVEVLETQLKISQAQPTNKKSVSTNEEVDHSLALKVADEIVRMQKNIARMDEDTKGLKPLLKGIERIRNNFAANGYEMINLLNADYDDRMNIDVINFNEDENLPQGKKLITKVIKPQVNYNGVMIQRAQVDVSQN